MTAQFFSPGSVYRHFGDAGPSELGVFVVACVGRAPEGFGVPGEAGGVAFGWLRRVGESGEGTPLGSYATADFTGWREVPDADLGALLGSALPAEAWLDLPRAVRPRPPAARRTWWGRLRRG